MAKNLETHFEEISSRYQNGETPLKISQDYDSTGSRISKLLKRHNVIMRSVSESRLKTQKLLIKEEVLERLYFSEEMSTEEIGGKYKVGASTVRRKLKSYGIPRRSPREIMLKGKKLPSKSKLEKLYTQRNISTLNIGKIYGVHRDTIERLILENRIPRKNNTTLQRENFPNKMELENEYVTQGKSAEDISKKYRISATTVRRELRRHQISIRSVSEAMLKKSFNKKN